MGKIIARDAVIDLLRQSYPLDPGSIEYLVEESTESSPDGAVDVVCHVLRQGNLESTHRENLGHFVRRAAAAPAVRQAMEKAAKKMGRCPKSGRAWLRRQLHDSARPQIKERIRPTRTNANLDLRDVSGSIAEFPTVMDRIGTLPPNPPELNIALGEFMYASALAAIAEWVLLHGLVNRLDFVDCSQQMLRYLEDIRFSAALRNPEIKISPDPMDWAVGLTRINRDQPSEVVTEKIVDILHTFVNPNKEDRQALMVLISEMIENVHRHAQTPVDGFAVAQVYPKHLKMGITLVDAGIGVQESFRNGHPSVPIQRLRTDEDFLREAVRLFATSKKERHSGYGLFLLSRLIGRNRGTFLLTSGTATLVGYQRSKELAFDVYHHRPWQGTIVSVIIDLKRQLPLLEVYREIPAPAGFEDDELFVE